MNLPYEQADAILHQMTLEQKIGQLVMASIEVTELDDAARRFLRENYVGNVILFGKNCRDRAQLARLTRQIQQEAMAYSGVQALISIDQEGGNVIRIRQGATVFPCAAAVRATGDPENAYFAGRMMGDEMRALGIHYDLAPVLDTNGAQMRQAPSRRSYGPVWQETAQYGGRFAQGLRDAGIIDCGKHFPGSGDSVVDTHFATSVVRLSAAEAREKAVSAFRQVMGEGLRSIMTSHDCFPGLDPACIPTTLSRKILRELVREELGFEGLIISDGMQMLAIADVYGAPQGCVMAVEAGCDLVITGNGGDNADLHGDDVQTPCIRAMLEAVNDGRLSRARVEESARRVIAFKLMLGELRPAEDAEQRDWRTHEAFSQAIADTAVSVVQDTAGVIPVPQGTLFLSRYSAARLGVEEGDHLVDGFAPLAARLLGGKALEFHQRPEVDAWAEQIREAPAVIVGVANGTEYRELEAELKRIQALNPRFGLVYQDAPIPDAPYAWAACVVLGYDQTIKTMRAACRRLQGK